MADDTHGPKEIKLNYPKPFSGKRENLKKFIQDCNLYLLVNKKTYDNDLARIAFILALMNDGDAAAWKEQFLDQATAITTQNNADIDLGNFKTFVKSLEETFVPYNAPGDALEKMKELQMKQSDSIDDHVAKFKMLVTNSGLGTTSTAIIDLFRESLSVPLQRWILTLEKLPKTLNEWYHWTTNLDHQW